MGCWFLFLFLGHNWIQRQHVERVFMKTGFDIRENTFLFDTLMDPNIFPPYEAQTKKKHKRTHQTNTHMQLRSWAGSGRGPSYCGSRTPPPASTPCKHATVNTNIHNKSQGSFFFPHFLVLLLMGAGRAKSPRPPSKTHYTNICPPEIRVIVVGAGSAVQQGDTTHKQKQ